MEIKIDQLIPFKPLYNRNILTSMRVHTMKRVNRSQPAKTVYYHTYNNTYAFHNPNFKMMTNR